MRARQPVGAVVVVMLTLTLPAEPVRAADTSPVATIDAARRDQKHAEIDTDAARKRLAAASDYLSASHKLRYVREAAIRACTDAKAVADKMLSEAHAALDRASNEERALNQTASAAKVVVDNLARRDISRPTIPAEFNAYSLRQNGLFTFNFTTGAWDVRLDPGAGISPPASEIEKIFGGSSPKASADLIDLAVDALGIKVSYQSNYEQIREQYLKQHGQERVYLISERLLDWADPRRFGINTGETELTGPASIAGELHDAARLIQLEYEDVFNWMKSQGDLDLSSGVREALIELINTGHSSQYGLSIRPVAFVVTKRFEPAGTSGLPLEVLRLLGLKRESSFRQGSFELDIPRNGFAIVRDKPPGNWSAASAIERFGDRVTPPAIDLTILAREIARVNDTSIDTLLNAFRNGTAGAVDLGPKSRALAMMAIAVKKDELIRRSGESGSIVNMMNSETARQVEAMLNLLGQGNQHHGTVRQAEIDLNSQRLTVAFTLEHRHRLASTKRALAEIRATRKSTNVSAAGFEEAVARAGTQSAARQRDDAIRAASEAARLAEASRERSRAARDRWTSWTHEAQIAANALARADDDLAEAKRVETLAQTEFDAANKELARSNNALNKAGTAIDNATRAFAEAVKEFFRQANPALHAMQAEAKRVWR